MATLHSSAEIISYVKGLSRFIRDVEITRIYQEGFYFEVKASGWYHYFFENRLRNLIQKNLEERMIIGIEFRFHIYSTELF